MKYKEVKLEDNKSVLVDESGEIKESDWHIDNGVVKQWKGNLHSNRLTSKKITATINHSIDLDVPMVIAEDEVEKWNASDYLKTHNLERGKSFNLWKVIVKGAYSLGYKAAQQKGVYSEAELRKAMDTAQELSGNPNFLKYTPDDIIQSLNQEYIELDTEGKIVWKSF